MNTTELAFLGNVRHRARRYYAASEHRDTGLAQIAAENLFDNIRSDPRWLPFRRRIGKAPRAACAGRLRRDLPVASDW